MNEVVPINEVVPTNELEDINSFDDNWITQYNEECLNEELINYNLIDITKLNLYFLFCDKNRNILHTKSEEYTLNTPNIITKEELVKKLLEFKSNKYSIINILKYNIDISFDELKKYEHTNNQFLNNIKLTTIKLNPSLKKLENLNSIYFILMENPTKLNRFNTKKVYISPARKTRRHKR